MGLVAAACASDGATESNTEMNPSTTESASATESQPGPSEGNDEGSVDETDPNPESESDSEFDSESDTPDAPDSATEPVAKADVTAVSASGRPGQYSFSVTIASDETGCEQYADWWEVVGPDGALVYRRILAHSHVNEQPFTRSGGPVAVDADTEVVVRAHMNPTGYVGAAYRGSVSSGFAPAELEAGFRASLERVRPLPTGCAF